MATGRFSTSTGMSIFDGQLKNEVNHNSYYPKRTSYYTNFPINELPFQGSGWKHGFNDGQLWNNLIATPGLISGTQVGVTAGFDDSIAHLTGIWGNDQSATATVVVSRSETSAESTGGVNEEVEILLRFSIDQGVATGYECTFSVDPNATNGAYIQLNRWNGALGSFTPLRNLTWATNDSGGAVSIVNGTVVSGSITGTVVTMKVGASTVLTYDTTADNPKYSSGSPGIGHFYKNNSFGGASSPHDFGFSDFTATST